MIVRHHVQDINVLKPGHDACLGGVR
jgi:hypothetical protein